MFHQLYRLINNDKFQHFVYGVAIYSLMLPFGMIPAFVVLSIIAVTKEYIDSKGFGAMEYKDAVVTVAGGGFLQSWYIVFEKLSTLF